MKIKNKEISKKTILKVISIATVAILFIPVLYSFVYLGAFWDPYGNMDNVPVAFVNLDEAVSKDGKEYHLGKDLQDNLKNNKNVKWKFVTLKDADDGVNDNSYYAMIVVPKDFSKKISDASNGKFDKPEIIYKANKGSNYIFSQISQKVGESLKSKVSTSISEETSKVLVNNLYDVKDSIKDAKDGVNTLHDGTTKLVDGSKELTTNLSQAADGSKKLQNGIAQAAAAESKLTDGASKLLSGLSMFKSSVSQGANGLDKLVGGAGAVNDGLTVAASNAQAASNTLHDKLTAASQGVSQVSSAINKADDIMSNPQMPDQQKMAYVKGILDGLKAKNIQASIADPLGASANSLQPLAAGLSTLQGGAKQVYDGTKLLSQKLADTQNQASLGADQLIQGASQIKDGSSQLSTGLNTLSSKTSELSDGLNKLSNGSSDLSNGLVTANDGTAKLNDGLNTGFSKLSDKLTFSSTNMSKYVSDPVTLKDESFNNVKSYGTGLAPYFISLSLWLGAMFANLILSITKITDAIENKFGKSFIGKFIIGASVVVIQSLILSFALMNGLGLSPVNGGTFYLTNILIGLVFFGIMYGLSCAIGIMSTPVIFVVFVLQLASCGGTFPIETAPYFYRAINKYIPMTYAVKLLRMVTAGINSTLVSKDVSILLTFGLSFLAVGLIIDLIKRFVSSKTALKEQNTEAA